MSLARSLLRKFQKKWLFFFSKITTIPNFTVKNNEEFNAKFFGKWIFRLFWAKSRGIFVILDDTLALESYILSNTRK